MLSSFNTIFLSLMGGVLPALLWLWFWLKEDRLHPEPKLRLMLVFLGGMAIVFIVLPLEKMVFSVSAGISLATVIMWAAIEELSKYGSAYFTALRNKVVDEPIDTVIYMITVALGFSALENTLFISNLVGSGLFSQSFITGNSRFLGATLLHVASSATIGIMMGLSYYKKPWVQKMSIAAGVIVAIALHSIFNLLIIKLENNLFFAFAGVWVLVVALIVLIEKVKKINH